MRVERIVRRKQEVKSMKARIRNLQQGMMVAFQAGRESVNHATVNMEHPNEEVASGVGDYVGGGSGGDAVGVVFDDPTKSTHGLIPAVQG